MKPEDNFSHAHEHKIFAERTMCAIDVRMPDALPDHKGRAWTVLTDGEARAFALDLLFKVDRDAWCKATGYVG